MKTLLLSADDIQNFNQLIYDTNTAAHFVNVAAAKQLNNTTTTNNNNTNSTLTISNNNNNNNNNNSTNKNLMALQYYLKQSGNYVPSSNTTSAAAVGVMSLPQLQQQQLQNVLAASTTTTAAAASALAQYQQQLQQQQQQHHLNHQHQQQQQQQQQLLAQSQTQLKHLQLKQPTIHHQHTSNYHHHPYYQQQQQTHHQQQQQQNAHHQLQQQLQLHQQKQQQQHHQLNSSSHLHQQQFHHQLLNIPNATTTTTSSSAAATTTQKKTTSSSTPNVPVHALNQNSNFSAASSSTGGGTISSHAPTQQSNGSSLSPPARQPQHQQQQQQHQNSTHLIAHIKTPVPTITKSTAPPTASSISTATRAVAINATIQRVNGVVAKVAVPATSATGTTVSVTSNTQCGKKIKGEPLLSEHYQSERLNFAKSFIVWNEDHWKRVIFQDERKFNLDGPDGFSYYFHDLRNYERTLSQRPRGNSVYVYLIISSNGPIHLEVSSSKFRLETCIETIMRERTNIINKLGGNSDFLVQDHNWSANASVATQEWLNGDHLKIQKWPTIAHDLNIMENIWGWLIREVYDGGRKFSRKDDLIFRIKEAWARLPKDLVTNLYSTLPERITELYYTRGIYTNC